MGKRPRSFSVGEDVVEQLEEREDINASALVDDFLREYLANGKTPDAALTMRLNDVEHKLENLRAERSRLESRIERLEREREDIEEQLSEREDAQREIVAEAVEKVERGNFPESNIERDNPAIKNWAAQAGLEPGRFVDRLRAELNGVSP